MILLVIVLIEKGIWYKLFVEIVVLVYKFLYVIVVFKVIGVFLFLELINFNVVLERL